MAVDYTTNNRIDVDLYLNQLLCLNRWV